MSSDQKNSVDPSDGKLPVRLLFSLLMGLFSVLLCYNLGKLVFKSGINSKAIVVGCLIVMALVYQIIWGRHDVAKLQNLSDKGTGVGLAHVGLIMFFVILITSIQIWAANRPRERHTRESIQATLDPCLVTNFNCGFGLESKYSLLARRTRTNDCSPSIFCFDSAHCSA